MIVAFAESRTLTVDARASYLPPRGVAPPSLLSSYEDERRPVAELTVGQGYLGYVVRAALYLSDQPLPPFVPDENVDLGYCYQSAAVIPDGDGDSPRHEDPR